MNYTQLIDDYRAGPALLEKAVAGMSDAQLDAKPVAGRWSTREVVCHLSDCEILYAYRMQRVLADDKPTLPNVDPEIMLRALAYDKRDIAEELAVARAVRSSMARLLQLQPASSFERVGVHTKDGHLTLAVLLQRITKHIPHHVQFIEEKRKALGI